MSNSRMHGRRVLLTGGASGIGRATAVLLRQEGAAVAVVDRNAAAAATVAAECDAIAITMDVSDDANVQRGVDDAAAKLGGLDGLVNAAGIFHPHLMMETDLAIWQQTLAVNMTGVFLVCRAAVPHLRRADKASIVNIASGVGLQPTGAGGAAYAASKAGVIGLTRSIAAELAPTIRVNAVCPGAVDTPMTAGFLRDATGAVAASIANRYAMKRPAESTEIAAAILFLLSHEASFVTGVSLAVDGGRTFH